jgi:type I restriction enzyme R subunit
MTTEADTCRKYVVPKLVDAGWDTEPHSFTEQKTFTDGRIVVAGTKVRRRPSKRADYLLRYTRDTMIAVVEAKPEYRLPGDGLQQAKDYAEILGLKFAYATNGHGVVEFDYLTGQERELVTFPSPAELWGRLRAAQGLSDDDARRVLAPSYHDVGKSPRYYQEIAINRAVRAIVQGNRRVLLTMATGTGKTWVAFQICWKLWSTGWSRSGTRQKPRILYLADRNVLVDDPKDKTFAPFGDARWKIQGGVANKSREIYFATYQSLAEDESRPGLYREYPPDFFDLVIVDEAHRGSARDESSWREILDYFSGAAQLGLTATPLNEESRNTYAYFGRPIYQYSLRQGIDDGFLAPYRVHRVVSVLDAAGWRPSAGDLDRYGRPIPDDEYQTKDFERVVALRARTEAIARHLTHFLKATDRFAKTIVFCVDQEHAAEMRRALTNLNSDLVRRYPDYVCRVTANEGEIGRGHLSRFQELESVTPVVLTTSQLLTTGVDAPTCKNVVLARVIGSMVEFKQIIGRGTRVRDDYGKTHFDILDYTGSATRLFADPAFDGEPVVEITVGIDDDGKTTSEEVERGDEDGASDDVISDPGPGDGLPRKFYVDGGHVTIAAHLVYELDADGKQLRVVQFTDYAAEKVRTLYTSASDLRARWADPRQRAEIIAALEERGINFGELATASGQGDADPFDLLCHLAFNAPLRTRRDRADRLRQEKMDFFDRYGPQARAVLDDLLDKYMEHGTAQFILPDALKVPPISGYGNVREIAGLFGGFEPLREAVDTLQTLLYAA